ncbi:hypothetical protein ACHAXS_006253 [Conticribra weissflogii]
MTNSSNSNVNIEVDNSSVNGDNGTFIVPTINHRQPRQMKTSQIKTLNIKLLKKEDPFMYYSIPSIRDNSTFLEEEGEEAGNVAMTIKETTNSSSMPRNLFGWMPKWNRVKVNEEDAASRIFRKSRLTFEYHIDVFMKDLMDDSYCGDIGVDLDALTSKTLTSCQEPQAHYGFANATNDQKIVHSMLPLQEEKNTRVSTEDHPDKYFFDDIPDIDADDFDEYDLLSYIDSSMVGRAPAA